VPTVRRILSQLRLVTATALAVGVAAFATACGGTDEPSSDGAFAPSEFTARSIEFALARRSDIGTKDAHVTFTSRSDGKTTAVVSFYVPWRPETRGHVYPVSVQEGTCSSAGETTVSLGDLSAGVTVLVLDESFDQAVAPLNAAESSLVIMKPDEKTVAWCGPGS
jgi:hypothetical protein